MVSGNNGSNDFALNSHYLLNYTHNNFYPYIVLPEKIELFLQGPVLPPLPVDLFPINLPAKPIPPKSPQAPQRLLGKLTASAFTGVAFLLFMGMIAAGVNGFLVLVMLGLVLGLGKITYDSFTYDTRLNYYRTVAKPQYDREYQNYLQRQKSWEQECENIQREHKTKTEQAEHEYREYCQETINRWLEGKLFPYKLNSQSLDVESNAKEGKLDSLLRDRMRVRLSELPGVQISLIPSNRGFTIPDFAHPYTPDVALKVAKEDKVFYIDIENDEPWYENDSGKQVIHGSDNSKQDTRDEFFSNKDWIVIRFCERQIYHECDRCVDFVLYVIETVLTPGLGVSHEPTLPTPYQRWNSFDGMNEWRPE